MADVLAVRALRVPAQRAAKLIESEEHLSFVTIRLTEQNLDVVGTQHPNNCNFPTLLGSNLRSVSVRFFTLASTSGISPKFHLGHA